MKNLRDSLMALPAAQRRTLLSQLNEREAAALLYDWSLWARPEQIAPAGAWRIWLVLAGRGFGKTRAITQWALQRAQTQPGSRGALVAPTEAAVRHVLVEGESGLLNVAPPSARPHYYPSLGKLVWTNGSSAYLFSAEQPDRLRGPQHHWAICDEIAAWRDDSAFDMLLLGLRLGDDPRVALATTPRPVPLIRRLLNDPTVAVTRGSTFDNRANLPPAFLNAILKRYAGTQLGRQEIDGALLDTPPDALFDQTQIDRLRVDAAPDDLRRVVIGVDPSASAAGDENGIVIAGLAATGAIYVLADRSLRGSPGAWAQAVAAAFHEFHADRVIAEVNNGGELVAHTLHTVDARLPITQVRASRGKFARAEPIAALYEQGRVHHVGDLPVLEAQMCAFSPSISRASPDRLDALVWAIHALAFRDDDLTPLFRQGRVSGG